MDFYVFDKQRQVNYLGVMFDCSLVCELEFDHAIQRYECLQAALKDKDS